MVGKPGVLIPSLPIVLARARKRERESLRASYIKKARCGSPATYLLVLGLLSPSTVEAIRNVGSCLKYLQIMCLNARFVIIIGAIIF